MAGGAFRERSESALDTSHHPQPGAMAQRVPDADRHGVPRFLRHQEPGVPPSPATSPVPPFHHRDQACFADFEAAERWAAGSYGPHDSVGSGVGGFTAWYFPFGGPGILLISQGVAVEFKDTLVENGGVIAPHPDLPATPEIVALALQVGLLPPPLRGLMLAQYQWTAPEQAPWLADLRSTVEGAWSFQHEFFLNRPRWDWIGADVAVSIDMHTSARQPDDHMDLEVFKTPPHQELLTFDIPAQVAPGTAADPRDQSMRLASTTTATNDLLRRSVLFAHDSSALDATAIDVLDGFIQTFNGAILDPAHQEIRVDLVAHTSASGSEGYNRRLAQRRADAVRNHLRDNGFHNVDVRVVEDVRGEAEASQVDPHRAEDRRVDLIVDGGERMNVAVHEWGHAFGLEDEYGVVGTRPGQHDMASAMTDAAGNRLPGAVREHNAGIMSFGTEVRPRHYATFHNALETVTAQTPWSLGPRRDRDAVRDSCDRPMGDFPEPDREVRPA